MNSVIGAEKTPDFIQGQIISRLNLDYLPEADRIRLLDSMAEVINQRILLRVLAGLPKDKSGTLAKLLDKGEDSEVAKFMDENVPDFLTVMQQEIDAVSNELESVSKSK